LGRSLLNVPAAMMTGVDIPHHQMEVSVMDRRMAMAW